MKTFKKFVEEISGGDGGDAGGDSVPANNIAHTGATSIAKYDPILGLKMFRRKKKNKKEK